MHPTLMKLLAQGPVVLDGAWGTELQKLGLRPGACPEAWNLEQPERVRQVAQSYVDAGSNVILTNTFGGSRLALARHDRAECVAAYNRAGVELSRSAASGKALVFASIGPSGCMLAAGDVTEQELSDAFAEQVAALAGAGADGLVLETFGDAEEAQLALAAAKASGLPVVLSLTYLYGAHADRTMSGLTPEQQVQLFEAADVLGINCGNGPAAFAPLIARIRAGTAKPIWCKPNAGLPVEVDGAFVYKETPAQFAQAATALIASGANLLGGCCGSTPGHIAAICSQINPRA
ncbi:MAG: homocysteine S-methyltransferase family protein [Verrucomicrobiota bacterium]|nr:homocysteine S-methyltransferase family protein [Verrucomicrobiota bacterium]